MKIEQKVKTKVQVTSTIKSPCKDTCTYNKDVLTSTCDCGLTGLEKINWSLFNVKKHREIIARINESNRGHKA